MPLNTLLRENNNNNNNIKFPEFNYLMRTKVRPITPSRWSGSTQRLTVRVSRQAILLQQIGVILVMMCLIYKASRIS